MIGQNNATPADITVLAGSSIPVCPATTGQSTFFESSGYDVTWSWNNRAAGQLDAYTGQVTWTTGFAGEVTLTATSMNCGFPSVSRKINIVSSSVISRTSAPGTDNTQTICKNSPSLIPITYSILGDATTASISGLPAGFSGTYSTTTQVDRVILSGINNGDQYSTSINGITYSITVSNTDTLAAATVSLAALIMGNADIASTSANVGGNGRIDIIAAIPNKYFYTSVDKTLAGGGGDITSQNVTGTAIFTITGTPSNTVGINTRHDYTITTGGSTCTPTTINGFFTQSPESQLILKVAGTDNQEVCNNSPITDIRYKILGTNGASVSPLVNFNGLPPGMTPGLNSAVTAKNQKEKVTITGTSATSSFSITINGTTTSTIAVFADNAAAAAGLETLIDGDPVLSTLVTTDDSAADGTLTITAIAAGLQFGISASKIAGTGSITITNEEGISEIRIFGTPNIAQNSQVQYIYTVTTNANPAGCTPAATITGTLKIAPLETVTYDNTINLALYPGAQTQTLCPGSSLEGISYKIGGAVGSVNVAGLPPGVSSTHSVTTQTEQFTFATVTPTDIVTIILNGASYSKNVTSTDDVQSVAVAISTLIDNDTDAVVSTATPGAGVLRFTADVPGVPFVTSALINNLSATPSATATFASTVSNVNNLVIEGTPDNTAVVNKPYNYTITTPGTLSCNSSVNGGTITIAEGPKFELVSAALTDSQERCNGSNIVDIEYKVTGAGGAQIPALVPATFSGLPANIQKLFSSTTQQESITITGIGAGVDEIKVYINGVEFSSGDVANPTLAADALVTSITLSINPLINGKVTAVNALGVMTLTATTPGTAFSLSVEGTGAGVNVTRANQVGTGTYKIYGLLNQSHNSEVTYNYTITSLLNLNACSAATVTGTIKVEPLETVTYNNTINAALYPGAATQNLCPGTTLEGISFKIGGAVGSVSVNGLPPGVTHTHSVTAQVEQFTIAGTISPTDIITILVNGVSYSKTVTSTDNAQSVAEAIATLIDNDVSATVTPSTPGAGVIRLTAETPGVPFIASSIVIDNSGGAAPTANITAPSPQVNVNNVVIEGSPDNTAIPNKPYTYSIVTPGSTCSPTTQGGTITIVEGPKFELISAALTDSQEECNGENIVDIQYKVTGAGGAQIPALVPATFSGLPANIQKTFNSTTQQESITITGIGAGVDEVKVYVNGVEFSSGDVANSKLAADALTASITASINPLINGKVVAVSSGVTNPGFVTITATTPGTAFSLSVEITGAGTNVIRSNQIGTGVYRIYGQLNQSHDSEVTYNYTITSLLNLNACTAATVTGTIKVEPLETVTYDNTINPTLYPGAATQNLCPGTTLEGISFKIGGAVGSVSVNGLPPGVTHTHSVTAQVEQFTIAGTLENLDEISVLVNGISYLSKLTATSTASSVALDIATLINNDVNATVTASSTVAGLINITAKDAGVPFITSSIANNLSGGGAPTAAKTAPSPQANVNNVVIGGTPDNTAIIDKPYAYTIETPGTTCSPTIQGGVITVSSGPIIELTSLASTVNQEVCNTLNIVDITYKVIGAGGAQIPALNASTFTGLPNSLSQQFNSTTQEELVTITGVTGAVDEIKVYINGVEFSSGDLAANGSAADALTASITASINPLINGKINASNVAGALTLKATTAGTPFTLSVAATGGTAAVTKANQVGTGLFTISGQLTQPHASEMTYNYTINTTLNGSCNSASTTGTIKIIPEEAITHDPVTDAASFGGPANQDVCENENIIGIRFNLTGGANSVSGPTAVPPAINGLPPGISLNHVRENQVEEYTITGIADTNPITVIINGISYTKTAVATDTNATMAQGIVNLIENNSNSTVTASSTAAGKILLTADNEGVPFTTSGIPTGGGAGIITKTATGAGPQNDNVNYVTLAGGPSENVPSTKIYNYTLTTTGTVCTDDVLNGSITINAISEISLFSAATTDNQIVCNGAVIDNIVYSIGGEELEHPFQVYQEACHLDMIPY
ncbi:MAG: beta strand repeat-containing protein [Flavobacteriaceae bacterium]